MKRWHALLIALLIPSLTQLAAQLTILSVGGSGSGGGSGTVTSVAATVPAEITLTGSPITTSGTLAYSWSSQLTSKIFAAPCGTTGTPTFRVLCAADIPALDPTKITGTAVITSDARLSDSRTPTAHASTHASAGSDPATLAQSQVTNLTVDLAGKQATGNYLIALTGDVAATGPGSVSATIQANSVALGTDTTGGYAGSSTEAGAATTANALQSATTTVDVSAATAPSSGQVLTATSGTAATWQTPSGGSAPFSDVTAIVKDDGDATKLFKIEASTITTGNTVTAAPPIATGTFTMARQDAAQTFTGNQRVNDQLSVGGAPVGSFKFTVTGTAYVQGSALVQLGSTAGTSANIGGTLSSATSDNGNTAATETFLRFQRVDQALANDNSSITVDMAGSFAATASVDKRLRVRIGPNATTADTLLFDSGDLAITTAQTWVLRGRVTRAGSSAQRTFWTLSTTDAALTTKVAYVTAAVSFGSNVYVSVTGAGTNANDVVAGMSSWIYQPF